MRLFLIAEADATQEELLKELRREITNFKTISEAELRGLVPDPRDTASMILEGMSYKASLLVDKEWWLRMFQMWPHLDAKIKNSFRDEIIADIVTRIKDATERGVPINFKQLSDELRSVAPTIGEAAGSVAQNIGRFLGTLAKLAGLLLLIIAGQMAGRNHRDGRGGRRGRRGDAVDEPAAPSASTDMFQAREFNPYIIYHFVSKCIKATKLMPDFKPYDEPEELPEEQPLETVTYPDADIADKPIDAELVGKKWTNA